MIYIEKVHDNFGMEFGVGAGLLALTMMLVVLLIPISCILAAVERLTIWQFAYVNHGFLIGVMIFMAQLFRRQLS